MKKKKLILIIIAVCCAILAGVVTTIALTQSDCEHTYGDAKVYHITNNEVYYTRACTKDGHVKRYETKASFADVLSTSTEQDLIVLDEDITLSNELVVKSYTYSETTFLPQEFNLEINLDLNGYKISTDIDTAVNSSVFMLDATFGTIDFDIKNGTIYTDDLKYVFNFTNSNGNTESIDLSIDGVESVVVGSGTITPLFVHNTCSQIEIEANNSKFIAKRLPGNDANEGAGAFINSNSECEFTNCYFEGGDGVYVKSGTVNLTNCELVNKDLTDKTVAHGISETFKAVGSCLTAESYNQENVGCSQFNIIVTNCVFNSEGRIRSIYVGETHDQDLPATTNVNSSIRIVSGTFNTNPVSKIYDVVTFDAQVQRKDATWTVGINNN